MFELEPELGAHTIETETRIRSRTETRTRTRTRVRNRTRTLQVKLGSTRQLEFEPVLYFGLQRTLELELELQAWLSFRCASSQVP